MIGLEDRHVLTRDIHIAQAAGARLRLACATSGIDLRTLQRWKAHDGLRAGDGRPLAVRPLPGHTLSEAEREQVLRVANEPRFAAVPPARIVPLLACTDVGRRRKLALVPRAVGPARCARGRRAGTRIRIACFFLGRVGHGPDHGSRRPLWSRGVRSAKVICATPDHSCKPTPLGDAARLRRRAPKGPCSSCQD